VKIQDEGMQKIAEVQYFFQAEVQHVTKTFALVSLYSSPNESLLRKSSGALTVCKYKGPSSLKVIPASSIMSVVGMVPFPAGEDDQEFFLVEKLGLEIAHMSGNNEEVLEE